MFKHRRHLVSSIAVAVAVAAASPARAQLLTIDDLFDQLTLLEDLVTLNGQAILNNTNSIVSVEADISLLNSNIVQIQNDLAVNNAIDATQSAQITAIDGRVTVVEAQTATNTGAIAALDVRLGANEALDVVQTTQINAINGRVTVLEGQTSANTGAIATLDARLDINDLRDTAQDAILIDHEQRLDDHDVQLASLDGRLTANDARDDAQDIRLDGHDVQLASLDGRLTANDARDDAQALLLVEHEARIWTAQGTADAAAADAANLRSAIVAGQIGLVQQASYSAPITVGAATGGDYVSFAGQAGDRRLGGVAAGVNANDAVNLSQMQLADAAILNQARSYTDTSIASLSFDLGRLTELMQYNDRELRQEIEAASAGAAALAGLPQAFQPGKGMVAIGMGGRGSNTAFAIGVGKAFNSPNTPVLRAGAAIDARRGDVTYNAAVGFHF
jgi:hypothetical protein